MPANIVSHINNALRGQHLLDAQGVLTINDPRFSLHVITHFDGGTRVVPNPHRIEVFVSFYDIESQDAWDELRGKVMRFGHHSAKLDYNLIARFLLPGNFSWQGYEFRIN
jgi:hypothetical protein